jgi:hypothetical protein
MARNMQLGNRDGGSGDPSKKHGMKRNSILFRLPYWKVRIFFTVAILFARMVLTISRTLLVLQ